MNIKTIRLVIVQPPVSKRPSEWDTPVDEMEVFRKQVTAAGQHALAVATIEKPDAYVHHQRPGEEQCEYCKGKANCTKYAALVGDTVFGSLEKLGDQETKPYEPHDVNLIASYYLKLKMIRDWCDAISEEAERMAKDGTITAEAHGLKFVREMRGVRRAWANESEAEQALLKSLNKADVYNLKLISPTDAEKKLKDKPRTWKKFEELIIKSDGSLKLVHISDKREAVSVAPNSDGFEDISDEQPTPVQTPAPEPVVDIDDLL